MSSNDLGKGSSGEWAIGMAINITGQLVINFATNLMKYTHMQNAARPLHLQKGSTKQKMWWVGMTFFTIGNLASFASFALAPQVLLSSLGSIQLISNIFWAHYLLKEVITKRLLIATAIMLCGQILAVAFSASPGKRYTAELLQQLYTRPPFIIYLSLVGVSCLALLFLLHWMGKKEDPDSERYQKVVPAAFAMVSTMIGSLSVMLAKSSSVLLWATVRGHNQFLNPFTYAVFTSWALVTVYWMYRFNLGLRRFDASYIVPLLQVMWTVFSIVSGGIYFEEFKDFATLNIFMFTLGVFIILAGVFLLSMRKVPAKTRKLSAVKALAGDSSDTELVLGSDMRHSDADLMLRALTVEDVNQIFHSQLIKDGPLETTDIELQNLESSSTGSNEGSGSTAASHTPLNSGRENNNNNSRVEVVVETVQPAPETIAALQMSSSHPPRADKGKGKSRVQRASLTGSSDPTQLPRRRRTSSDVLDSDQLNVSTGSPVKMKKVSTRSGRRSSHDSNGGAHSNVAYHSLSDSARV